MSCTILIADDDVVVRNKARLLLEREGHFVLVAKKGLEALALSRRYSDVIDLLLADRYLSGMDGVALAAQILVERPKIVVLVMAGRGSGDLTALPILQKPFSPAMFKEKIREVLRKPCADP